MRRMVLLASAVTLLASCAVVVSGARSAGSVQARWVIRDLGTLGGRYSVAADVNERGQVVGTSRPAEGEPWHVFLWEKGRMTDLGLYGNPNGSSYGHPEKTPLINERGQVVWVWPGRGVVMWANGVVRSLGTVKTRAEAHAINDKGQVVGVADTKAKNKGGSPHWRAFLWQKGRITNLSSDYYEYLDINERGQIAGLLDHGQATVWEKGKRRRLGTLGGKESHTVAINDRGQVTGCADTKAKDSLGYPIDHAFLWQNGKMTDLGGCWVGPLAINNRGDVIFFGVAEFWRNGQRVKLGTLGGTYGNAGAINDVGQVVGTTVAKFGSRTQERAFVSDNGVMTDLGTLDGGKASGAVAINNKGQIVGTSATGEPGRGGYYDPPSHAVLWTLRSG